MTKIKLNQLEMLVAAVDAGSFSAAGAELGCTQSRISHGIAELERNVGATLLIRSRTGCVPTHAGQQVLASARQMLNIADGVARAVCREAEINGQVQVACVRSASTHLLPYAVEALAKAFPGINVEIHDGCHDYGEVTAMIEQGFAHIGITRTPVGEHLMSRPYVYDPYVVIAPACAELKSPVCWNELSLLPFIHIQQPGAMWIVEQCRAAGFEQRPARRLASEGGILALISRGLGYTVLPRLAAFPDIAATKILELPFPAKRYLTVFAKPAVARSKVVKTVIQFILDKRLIQKTDAWRAGAIGIS
jgi:DNA-binding transcriptional LysR family regulator